VLPTTADPWQAFGLFRVLWDVPTGKVIIALFGGAIFLSMVGRRTGKTKQGNKPDVKLPKQGGPHLVECWRHEQSVKVGGKRIDIAWRHVGVIGTSGSRKSTLLAMLLEQIGKNYVAIAGDHAPPLLNITLARGYRVWKPRGEVGWYPWGGDLELAVQRVEHMFPASGNDAGVHRSMFKQAARKAWANVDERGRTVQQVIAKLPDVVTGTSGKSMAENWTARLNELIESLGDSLRTASDGGLDLVELVSRGESMMFALNSFADVSNRERFAKIAILETLRAADSVGNLSVAIDEVGLLGAELFAESVRTLRVRLCTGMFASHIAKDFPEVLKGLINVWFLGQVPGSDKPTRDWQSTTTFGLVPSEHFGEHALPLGTFYLVANGRVQKLKVPTWKTRPVPEKVAVASAAGTYTQCTEEEDSDAEASGGATEAEFREMVYEHIRVEDGWRVWRGSVDADDYPRQWWPKTKPEKSKYESVHRWVYQWETGDGVMKGWTIDHVCGLKRCLDHLEKVTAAENTRRRHERERGERPTGHEGMVKAA
jgi:hypothetical protein